MSIPLVDLELLKTVFARMERNGVSYGYGVKAPSLDCDTSIIKSIDCSGATRYGLAKATNGAWIVPDGSQAQLEYCEQKAAAGELHKLAKYSDVQYATEKRLFWCFIKVNTNGCGSVGHTFFITQEDSESFPESMESHGGGGVIARPWNTGVLKREAYAAFEIPVK